MKANKKGISLIVLIITIIVIIILAAAIILSMTKSNPIKNANRAVNQSDMKTAQEAFTLWLGDRWSQTEFQNEVGSYYSGTITQTTPATINYSTTGKITDSNAGSPVQLADGSGDQTFTTEDFGLEQFEQMVIENNTIKSVRKGGVTLTYDPTTGEVTSSK